MINKKVSGVPMKPTQDQIDRIKIWLDTRLSAIFAGRPFPRLPLSMEMDLKNGVDFSNIFAEYGFAADGLQLLPNFYEINRASNRVGVNSGERRVVS
jgi:hypothetical protein